MALYALLIFNGETDAFGIGLVRVVVLLLFVFVDVDVGVVHFPPLRNVWVNQSSIEDPVVTTHGYDPSTE